MTHQAETPSQADTTAPAKAPGVRARVRAQLTAEIKAAARTQLATEGAAALSLRAIARDLDMASSAIYRYFASREELLTALIVDAYDSVGAAVEDADEAVERALHHERMIAIGLTIRRWAHANPHEYALIYGSPVPGYAAPQDTIDPAIRVPVALIAILIDRFAGVPADTPSPAAMASPLFSAIAELSAFTGHSVSPELLARGVQAWGEIFGLISLELFGHFKNAVTDPQALFEHAMRELAARTLAETAPQL